MAIVYLTPSTIEVEEAGETFAVELKVKEITDLRAGRVVFQFDGGDINEEDGSLAVVTAESNPDFIFANSVFVLNEDENPLWIEGRHITGTGDALIIDAGLTELSDGTVIAFPIYRANTITEPTANVNNLGAKTVVRRDGTPLEVGDMSPGSNITLLYVETDDVWRANRPRRQPQAHEIIKKYYVGADHLDHVNYGFPLGWYVGLQLGFIREGLRFPISGDITLGTFTFRATERRASQFTIPHDGRRNYLQTRDGTHVPFSVENAAIEVAVPETPGQPETEVTPAAPAAPATDAGTLASSRNHFRSTPGGEHRRPPRVDIDEPIVLRVGQQKLYNFEYDSGDPPANTFGMEWYRNQADADARQNPFTGYEIETRLSPASPIPNPNVRDHKGQALFTAPDVVPEGEPTMLIGKILIYYR